MRSPKQTAARPCADRPPHLTVSPQTASTEYPAQQLRNCIILYKSELGMYKICTFKEHLEEHIKLTDSLQKM